MECTRREALTLMGAATGAMAMGNDPFLGPEAPAAARPAPGTPSEQRERLYGLLGDLPDRKRSVSARRIDEQERDGYVLERLELDLNGIEPVPAFFAKPKGLSGPAPTVLFNHSHGGGYDVGKKEFVEGRSYLQDPPYAKVITALGWTGLCIDTWVFGERSHTREDDMFKAMLWQGHVLWGMMVFDSLKTLDYLVTRPEVDPHRMATLGISMGSTMAWWTAALDERIKVCVDICCLTDFHTFLRKAELRRHGLYYYVPGLLNHFTTAGVNALIAPRAHLGIAGLQDPLTPVEGLEVIDAELKRVYAAAGVPDNWRLLTYDVGHQETPEARTEILRFLQEKL